MAAVRGQIEIYENLLLNEKERKRADSNITPIPCYYQQERDLLITIADILATDNSDFSDSTYPKALHPFRASEWDSLLGKINELAEILLTSEYTRERISLELATIAETLAYKLDVIPGLIPLYLKLLDISSARSEKAFERSKLLLSTAIHYSHQSHEVSQKIVETRKVRHAKYKGHIITDKLLAALNTSEEATYPNLWQIKDRLLRYNYCTIGDLKHDRTHTPTTRWSPSFVGNTATTTHKDTATLQTRPSSYSL